MSESMGASLQPQCSSGECGLKPVSANAQRDSHFRRFAVVVGSGLPAAGCAARNSCKGLQDAGWRRFESRAEVCGYNPPPGPRRRRRLQRREARRRARPRQYGVRRRFPAHRRAVLRFGHAAPPTWRRNAAASARRVPAHRGIHSTFIPKDRETTLCIPRNLPVFPGDLKSRRMLSL